MQSGHGRGPQDQRLLPMAVADRRLVALAVGTPIKFEWLQHFLALPRASHAAWSPASREAKGACTGKALLGRTRSVRQALKRVCLAIAHRSVKHNVSRHQVPNRPDRPYPDADREHCSWAAPLLGAKLRKLEVGHPAAADRRCRLHDPISPMPIVNQLVARCRWPLPIVAWWRSRWARAVLAAR